MHGRLPDTNAKHPVKALYALDPVGSLGIRRAFRSLFGGNPTPPEYLGFKPRELPANVEKARVVLMASESRTLYQPNVYDSAPDRDLCQSWFIGVHKDAWGPSPYAIYPLAYILGDVCRDGIQPDFQDDGVKSLLALWTSNGHQQRSIFKRLTKGITSISTHTRDVHGGNRHATCTAPNCHNLNEEHSIGICEKVMLELLMQHLDTPAQPNYNPTKDLAAAVACACRETLSRCTQHITEAGQDLTDSRQDDTDAASTSRLLSTESRRWPRLSLNRIH